MTAQPQSLPIVVGVDGSANGDRALDWAVRHAIRAQRPLRIVHVPEPSLLARLFPARRRAGEQAARQLAQELVDSRVARARAADAALDVVGEVVSGPRDACLEQESRRAELMVVGSRGLSGTVESLVTGSATTRLVLRASCPVVVVPEGASRTSLSRVVAGTDASQQSRAAVDLAFTLSRTWQARLRVVLAWDPSAFAWLTEEDPSWPAEQTPSPSRPAPASPVFSPLCRTNTRMWHWSGMSSRAQRFRCWLPKVTKRTFSWWVRTDAGTASWKCFRNWDR